MISNEKTKQILDAAKELFTLYGYKKVSMDEIAKSAGVVKSTIYQYFRDKEDLLQHFINEEISRMKDMVEDIEKNSNSTFEMIHKTIYELLMYRQNQKFLVAIAREAESIGTVSVCKSLKCIDKSIIGYIEKRIEIGINKSIIRKCNPKVMAFLLFRMYVSLAIDWEKENEKLDEKEISDNISLFLKEGLFV